MPLNNECLEMPDLILESETDFPLFNDKKNRLYGVFNYTHESFYKAMEDSEMDIFKCVENGKLYLPCERELYIYKGKRNRITEKQ